MSHLPFPGKLLEQVVLAVFSHFPSADHTATAIFGVLPHPSDDPTPCPMGAEHCGEHLWVCLTCSS